MHGVQPGHVLLVVRAAPHAEERPGDRPHRLHERHRSCRGVLQILTGFHSFACSGTARAACLFLPATSKKVYDRVIVFTSLGSFGSITKTTGHCLTSPGCNVYSLKQKHSSLLKWAVACFGA